MLQEDAALSLVATSQDDDNGAGSEGRAQTSLDLSPHSRRPLDFSNWPQGPRLPLFWNLALFQVLVSAHFFHCEKLGLGSGLFGGLKPIKI